METAALEHRVIIVTGASSGIGEAVALACGAQGMQVVLAARRAERLNALARHVEAVGGRALVCPTDMRSAAQIEMMVQKTLSHFGRVDILFANAGLGCHLPVAQATDADIAEVIETNLMGVIRCARAVLPAMIAQNSGHILTVSSVIIGLMWPNDALYAASKAGVHRFSRGLRNEVKRHGIRVTDVIPGVIDTPLNAGFRGRKADVTHTAQEIIGILRRPRPVLVTPGRYRLALLANSLFPGLLDRYVNR